MKIFIACLATETNTYAPLPTGWNAWKAKYYTRTATREPANLFTAPLHEWRRMAEDRGWEVVESLSTFAEPAGITPRSVYETMRDEILTDLEAAMPDIFLISMHGAMVADGYEDCEGDMMKRARAILGADQFIGLELDPHNHMTEDMLTNATAIISFKEYPHIDAPERARELFQIAADTAEGKIRPLMRDYDCRMLVMVPTLMEPGRTFVQEMKQTEGKDGVLSLSLTHGFSYGDVERVGMRMIAITDGDAEKASAVAEQFGRRLWALRHQLYFPRPGIEAALDEVAAARDRPYVLADMADNPGAGAPSESTHVLRAMLDRGMTDVALALFWDPVLVAICQDAGEGARLQVRVGGKIAPESGDPVDLEATVRAIRKNVTQFLGDAAMNIGDVVWLEADGVHILVNSIRAQCFNPSVFTDLGIDITQMRALVVKSMNHFYAGFAPIAAKVIHMGSPGACEIDRAKLPLTKRDGNYFPRVGDPFAQTTKTTPGSG
ncbi:M81 family metallopeptidase [Pseudophaeobacter flagellatus]|uniref:M81 family metallopeptidase n=1 Tax=Pseudophaeobacter flagellatus TaxID=2899119 RepID=UPI001E6311D5|nr:M81 family metallopeptidase [Pseudophaeobacter flagellatus]MCD9149263.1 M81 family metallopeptidase [Pseudophaeobacter flagellatus]